MKLVGHRFARGRIRARTWGARNRCPPVGRPFLECCGIMPSRSRERFGRNSILPCRRALRQTRNDRRRRTGHKSDLTSVPSAQRLQTGRQSAGSGRTSELRGRLGVTSPADWICLDAPPNLQDCRTQTRQPDQCRRASPASPPAQPRSLPASGPCGLGASGTSLRDPCGVPRRLGQPVEPDAPSDDR